MFASMTSRSAPTLPSTERPRTFDGDITLPLSTVRKPAPPVTEDHPRTRAERIAAATARGGLDAIPAGFDDADGDWQVISSASLFERLYLDAAQSDSITAAMSHRHYALFRDFWNEKIAAMQTGAAKTQILIKFGGPHRSEELVRGYPRDLKKALDRLGTDDGIAAYRDELETNRRNAARNTVEPLLEFIFANESLEPAETDSFFTHAAAAGMSIDEAATMLHDAIVERDFQPLSPPVGESLGERLLSVQWLSPARLALIEKEHLTILPAAAQAVMNLPATPTRPPVAVYLFLFATLLVLAIGGLWLLIRKPPAVPIAPEPVVTTSAAPPPAPAVVTETVASKPPVEIQPQTPKEEPPAPPRVDTAAIALQELLQQEAAAEKTRAEAQRLERERSEAQAAATHVELENMLQHAEESFTAGDLAAATALLEDARSKAVTDAFAAERSRIDVLRRKVQQRELQTNLYNSRISDLESLNREERYPEAIAMANRILKEADLPAEVATRAKAALTFAEGEMAKLMKDSTLKGVRTRRTNKGRSR